MIRWVPPKITGLGQGAPVATPAPKQEPWREKRSAVVDSLVVGGLVVAGLAFLWAITMTAPNHD